MTLCMVLMPLSTRNKILKNRITQSIEKPILKNNYILHKLHDHKIHKSVLQSLLLTELVSENMLTTLQQILLVPAQSNFSHSCGRHFCTVSDLLQGVSVLSHASLSTFCTKASKSIKELAS